MSLAQLSSVGQIASSGLEVRRNRKQVLLGGIAILLGVAIPLLLGELVLWFLPVTTATRMMATHDGNPIGRLTPNQEFVFSKGWRFDIVNRGHVNNYGFVNNLDYTRHTSDGPMVIVGDSYVEAMMVPYEETVHGRLAVRRETGALVYSVGLSGAQLADYVGYAEYAWKEFRPRSIVFIIVGNDFDESLSQYKEGPGFRFVPNSEGNDLKLMRKDYQPSELKSWIRHSALIRYLWCTAGIGQMWVFGNNVEYVGNTAADASQERLANSRKAIDQFLTELSRRVGLDVTRILFVVDGMRPALYSAEGRLRARGSYFDEMRCYFLTAAARKGYEVIDMEPRFIARHAREHVHFEWSIDGHWNSAGHQEAAEAIATSDVYRRSFFQEH